MIDFDAFLKEQRAQHGPVAAGPSLRVGGKTYELPRELPAVVALDIVRLKKRFGKDEMAPPEALMAIGEGLFGRAAFAEILEANRLTVAELGALIGEAFKAYGPAVEETGDPNSEALAASSTTTST